MNSFKYLFLLACFSCHEKKSHVGNKENRPVIKLNKDIPKANKTVYYEADSLNDSKIKKYTSKLIQGFNIKGYYTSVNYENTLAMIKRLADKAKIEALPNDIFAGEVSGIKDRNIGGLINFKIIRNSIEDANLIHFTIIIKDSSEHQIFEKTFPFTVGQKSGINSRFWNIEKIDINKKIRPPFYVCVFDNATKTNLKFYILPQVKHPSWQ